VARAAQRGAQAELKPTPLSSLERSLDQTIEYLVERPMPESRALLIEAKRLRSVVANWRSLAPNEAVYQDMVQRALSLSVASGASLYDPAHDLRAEIDPFVMTEEAALIDLADDPEVYFVDFEPHLYSLAVLAPSGRAGRVPVPETAWSAAASPITPLRDPRAEPARDPRAEPARDARAEPAREGRAARPSEAAPPLLRVVKTEAAHRPSSHPPEKPARSYPPEVFDDAPEPEAPPLSQPDAPLSYPRVPQFTAMPASNVEGELVYPSLPPIERGTTGMLRPMALPSFPSSSLSTNTPTGRADPSDDASYSRADRPRTVRPPMPELAMDEERSPSDAPLAPQTSVEVVVLDKPEKVDPNLVMISDPYGDRADAFRALRRKLASSGNPHVILVTSAGSGDGKTTTAINLAVALREGIRGKVLLLEGNLSEPGVAKALGFEPPVCFDAQITSHQEADPLAPWVAAELLPQFHVMAVDPKKEHKPLFDPVAFANGMTRLRGAGYEFIVIDSPPAIGSGDVRMIADLVDGTLFTAIRLKSKRAALREAMELIQPSPMLGVVMADC
jgi:Mrp family chromosome partitioning ATPase